MRGAGRPLRFVAYVLGGWVLMRVAFLMPEAVDLAVSPPVAQAAPAMAPAIGPPAIVPSAIARRHAGWLAPRLPLMLVDSRRGPKRTPGPVWMPAVPAPAPSATAPVAVVRRSGQDGLPMPSSLQPAILPRAGGAARFSGTAWVVARDGGRALSDAGQLGGSQAGMRLRYALGTARTLAATVRVSAPLRGSGSEGAVGIEWRPVRANLAIIAEQRFGIDGTADGQAVFIVGGVGPTEFVGEMVVEGYGQAGAVARGGAIEAFADGAVRLTRPILPGVTVGCGAWGGAQRDAQRIDLGPTATIALPVAGRTLRLAVDWRQRVVGQAAPGSGLAVTLGADF